MKLRLLVDENLSQRLKFALQRRYPEIDVLRVGDEGAPAFGTLDPDVLRYLEANQRVLLTDDRESMPNHLAEHAAQGGHHWGIFEVRQATAIGPLVELLFLYWEATEAEEWIDRVEWLVVDQ